jgi:hypothetical protein
MFLDSPEKLIEPTFAGLTGKHLMHDGHNRNAIDASAPAVEPKKGRVDEFVL